SLSKCPEPRSTGEGLDPRDLDRDRLAVGGLVRGLLADLQTQDRLAERAGFAVHVEFGVAGDLTTAEEEDLFAACDDGGDHGSGLDDAAAGGCDADLGGLQQMLERADASLLLALLVLRRMVATVLLEIAFFSRGLDALGDLIATD